MSKHRTRTTKATEWFASKNRPGDRSFRNDLDRYLDFVPDDHPELVALRRKLLVEMIELTNQMPVFILSSRADRAALLQLAIEHGGAIIIPGRK